MISCITTCKGRLEHLKQTLPLIVSEVPGKHVLVDYDCPDQSWRWVRENFQECQVLHLLDRPKFHKTDALNLGANLAIDCYAAEWLCFIDADMRVKPGLHAELERVIRKGKKFVGVVDDHTERIGFLFVSRNAFQEIGGFDEAFIGWGCEDIDMRLRLFVDAGATPYLIDRALLSPIKHDDDLRCTFQPETKRQSLLRNYQLLQQHMLQRRDRIKPEIQQLLRYDGGDLL